MSQMKHFGAYNGQDNGRPTFVQDQALHQVILVPFEGGFVGGKAAATMCSYQDWGDPLIGLGLTVSNLTQASPYSSGSSTTQTWPLNEVHFSCEHPLALTQILRNQWGSNAFVATDYFGAHTTSMLFQGTDQETPNVDRFYSPNGDLATAINPNMINGGGSTTNDPTGSTCADANGNWVDCTTPGATHIAGIPNKYLGSGSSGCTHIYGCALVDAVLQGSVPLSVLNQSLARIL